MVIKLRTDLKVFQEEIQEKNSRKNNLEFRISSLELNITKLQEKFEQDGLTIKYLENYLNNQFQKSRYVYEVYDNNPFETISLKITDTKKHEFSYIEHISAIQVRFCLKNQVAILFEILFKIFRIF
jgi:predicted  nucleic acid-binding Zn-ribbon protein